MANLDSLPPELTKMIAERLDNWDGTSRHRLALVSRTLCAKLYATPCRPPRMTRSQWIEFNNHFERDAPSRPTALACSICTMLLPQTSFIDRQARKTTQGNRVCLACGIRDGRYQKVSFRLAGVLSFACGGCRTAMPMVQEDSCVENDVWRNNQRHQSPLGLPGAVSSAAVIAAANADPIGVSSVGMRWCTPCWSQRKTTVRLARP